MDLRTALIQLRKELHFKQSDLANALQLNFATVNRWETGKNFPNRTAALAIVAYAKNQHVSVACQEALKKLLFPDSVQTEIDDLTHTQMNQIHQMLNESSNGVFVCDVENYELLYVNQRIAHMVGCAMEAAKGKKCYEFIFQRNMPCPFCHVGMLSDESFHKQEYVSQKTGKCYMMRGKRVLWNDRMAHIEYVTDITELHQMHLALEQNQKILNAACQFAEIWIFTYAIKTNTAYPNKQLQEQFSLPAVIRNFPEEVFAWNMILPECVLAYRQMVQHIKDGHLQAEIEIQAKYYDGQIHWLRFRMNTIQFDAEGKPELAICSAQPIDDKKFLETLLYADSSKNIVNYFEES